MNERSGAKYKLFNMETVFATLGPVRQSWDFEEGNISRPLAESGEK